MAEREDDGIVWGREFEFWEHQGSMLTVGVLRDALAGVDRSLPVVVAFHDGERVVELDAMELGPSGTGNRPESVVLTVVSQGGGGRS